MHPLIYDWNAIDAPAAPTRPVMLDDETLRDGLQSPSVRTPSIDEKIRILHLIDALGIDTADIGLPGAGPHVVARRRAAGARDRRRRGCACAANCAARTVDRRHHADRRDLAARRASRSSAARSSGRARSGSTPKDWTLDKLLQLTEEAVAFAVGEGPAGDVRHRGHDARRSRTRCARCTRRRSAPARSACASPTPSATRRRRARAAVVRFVQAIVDECGGGVGIDWHGHRDRDLAVINSAGGDRGRRDAPARRGDRHRRARRQHADGHCCS